MIKELVVKDWFLSKKENEKGVRLNSNVVYAKLKESEKAVQVMVADTNRYLVFWCPKSCLEINTFNDGKDTITDLTNVPQYDDYHTMIVEWKNEMEVYK